MEQISLAQCPLAAFVLLVLLTSGCVAGEVTPISSDRPIHKGSRILASGELTVEVMDPASPERYNRGVRFTPVAAVIRATIGGREYLANPKEHDSLFAAAGLFAEFDLTTSPPGFDAAKIGEGYMKIGVGILKKDEEKYSFWPQHELLQAAKTEVEWGRHQARFHQTCGHLAIPVAAGAPLIYAYELTATMKMAGRELSVEWSLKNTGETAFETEQYTHNIKPTCPLYSANGSSEPFAL